MSKIRSIANILDQIMPFLNDVEEKNGWIMTNCPFHDDKIPSFGVNFSTGGYNCFGCGESGTVNQLATKMGIAVKGIYRPSFKRKSKPKQIQPWLSAKRIIEAFDMVEDSYKEAFRKKRNKLEEDWNEGLLPEVDYYTQRDILIDRYKRYMEIHDENRNRLNYEAKLGVDNE